jgi:hypothetical protein
MQFFQIFGIYKELFLTGGFQCTAEGDNVLIDIHGNVAGDILVFIGPNGKTSSADTDIMELIRSDLALEAQWKVVIRSLKYKFIALAAIPKIIAWLFNALILYTFYSRLPFDSIFTLTDVKNILAELLYRLPLALPLLTLVYGKAMGYTLMKPLLLVIVRLIWLGRIVFKKKVA